MFSCRSGIRPAPSWHGGFCIRHRAQKQGLLALPLRPVASNVSNVGNAGNAGNAGDWQLHPTAGAAPALAVGRIGQPTQGVAAGGLFGHTVGQRLGPGTVCTTRTRYWRWCWRWSKWATGRFCYQQPRCWQQKQRTGRPLPYRLKPPGVALTLPGFASGSWCACGAGSRPQRLLATATALPAARVRSKSQL